ncbi:MAG TPA: Crp/Fnr family transcriptional regulator [Pirellulaceae bacterium]|nr:Crp/Fnr family transcriptional regulator [Pirellulaceae bacterium]HMO91137.1 Crp/Fnr family transcriptional regulator [Pirellulaceae bacterium]HMP69092.1 Crp/Fnr family transcriptional regulator [Pirellulaceae bacterium]
MDTYGKVCPEDLAHLDFSAELTGNERAILASLITPLNVVENQTLFRCGDPADACYLVQHGLLALEICAAGIGCRRIGTVGPGELIGWSPFLPGSCFSATARVLNAGRVFRIPAEPLRQACDQNPEFGYHILRRVVRVLAARINATRMQMLDLFGPESAHVHGTWEPTGDTYEDR